LLTVSDSCELDVVFVDVVSLVLGVFESTVGVGIGVIFETGEFSKADVFVGF